MKKTCLVLLGLFLISLTSAGICNLDASFINQDPYPAVPGDYIKLVFQLDGLESPDCGQVNFKLIESYPLVFDPETNPIVTATAGTFSRTYSSSLLAPYKVRIDENALDGENPIEVEFSYQGVEGRSTKTKQFNLQIEDVKADFEITIKNYNLLTKTLTLEILNIGESDIEALTLEILDQENIDVKGSFRNIVGDLDSNDYTTADFEATPSDGEIKLSVLYTDSINERRSLEKTIMFDSKYFEGRANGGQGTSGWFYIIVLLIIAGIIYWIFRRRRRKKLAASHRH
tara:strand:+ start:1123 stop:1980 length:858 start_codon:yes stop_codon:yes gene_type:complete